MAGNTIDINLNVQDVNRTIQARTADARELNRLLERTQALAAGTGTRSGNQAMGRAAAFGGEVSEYNVARGVAGGGGAAARDFADQARGLGPLVRLYATFAATMYTVSTAFNALREAMNTDIMIRGMQQLSAASGASLASMTKGFISATDGMVSFREAAEAVTKATTSGMGRDQVMAIADVAKGASQALGLNMGDAVSRLTRGITKLEPELLDELGIFTKLDKAVSDYARTVGKSESSLTDFERRQAFANAVLDEGKKKFSEIAQEGNPYDKLLASLKDVAQSLLSVVNSVVGPIAKVFADNSALIGGAIALIAANIVTKAIPALGKYTDYLKSNAQEAAKIATGESQDAWAGQYERLRKKSGILASEERMVGLAKERVELTAQLDLAKSTNANLATRIGLENRIQVINASITREKQLQARLDQTIQDRQQQKSGFFTDTWGYMKEKIAQTANQRSLGLDIKQEVVGIAEEQGPIAALEKLGELLKKSGDRLSTFGKVVAGISSAFGILAQTVLTTLRFISRFIPYIGQVIAAYELFQTFLSSNAKETKKFETTLDELTSATQTATDVNQKYAQSFSVDAVLAYSNSFDELTKSMKKTTDAFMEAKAASNWGDSAINFVKEYIFFLDSLEEKQAKVMGAAIGAQITTLGDRPEGTQYKQDIGNLLGIDPNKPINTKTITNALEEASSGGEKFAEIQRKIVEITDQANKKFQEQTLYLKGLKESASNAEKSAATFMNSLKDSSNVSTMMENTLKYLVQLNKALQSTDFRSQVAALDSLKDANFGALFGESAVEIARLSDQFEEMQPAIDAASKELEKAKGKLKELNNSWLPVDVSEIIGQENLIAGLENIIATGKQKIAELNAAITTAISKSVADQAAKTIDKFKLEFDKLAIEQAKFKASKTPVKTVELLDYQNKLEKQGIDIETRLINSNYDLADTIDDLNFTIKMERDQRRSDELQLKTEVARRGGPQLTDAELKEQKRLADRLDPEYMAKAQLLTMGRPAGMSQKEFDKEIAKYLQIFPEYKGKFDRTLSKDLKIKAQEYKKEASDINTTIAKIDLTTQRAIEDIDNRIGSFNSIISNLGSDTPERIDVAITGASMVLDAELQKIELLTKQKLDNLAALKLPEEADKASQAQIKREKDIAIDKKRQETAQTLIRLEAEKTAAIDKRRLDIIVATAEAQKGLIVGGGLIAEGSRQALDRTIREAQDAIQMGDLEKRLRISQGALQEFRRQNAKTEILTPEQQLTYQGLTAAVASDQQAIISQKGINALRKEGADIQDRMNLLSIQQGMDMADLEVKLQREQAIRDRVLNTREEAIDIATKDLDIAEKRGLIIDRELQLARADLAINRLNLEYDREASRIANERLILEQQINDEKARNPTARVITQTDDEGNVLVTDYRTDAQRRMEGQLAGLDTALENAREKTRRGMDMINKELEITPRMQKFDEAFTNMFNGMADAIVNFAKTGKFEFKALISSFIDDILRYELKLQMHALYVQALRPALIGLFPGLGGTGGGFFSNTVDADTWAASANALGMAKGGAFNRGVEAYARGGMFTNSIVNQPTLFKAAKGLGVMGEAGPEAIMPLKRDSYGNLGVRSNQGSVEVVVNNYSGEKAEARETIDNRGNRRVEVVVGDMVADQMGRTNSSVQQAMLSGYAVRPRMVRR